MQSEVFVDHDAAAVWATLDLVLDNKATTLDVSVMGIGDEFEVGVESSMRVIDTLITSLTEFKQRYSLAVDKHRNDVRLPSTDVL